MQEFICIDPTIGRWIGEFDVPYLLSVLASEETSLAEMLPDIHMDRQQRSEILAAIEEHLKLCQHCSLKLNYDLEFDARTRNAIVAEEGRIALPTEDLEFYTPTTNEIQSPHLFLCHSSADKKFVRKLASDLTELGVRVWLDEWELKVGDSLHECIEIALSTSAFVGVVMSPESMKSRWCKEELNAALSREIQSGSKVVLPLLHRSVPLPPFLVDRLYLDFRRRRLPALAQLAAFIHDLDSRELVKLISQTPLKSFQDVRNLLLQLGWQNTYHVFVPSKEYERMLGVLRRSGIEIMGKEFELLQRLSSGAFGLRTKVTC